MEKSSKQAQLYYGRKAKNLCPMCGSDDIDEGKIQCRNCLAKLVIRNHESRRRSKAAGLCQSCHKQKAKEPYTCCADCRERYSKYTRKDWTWFAYGITLEERDALVKTQNYCCAICGGKFNGKTGVLGPQIDHNHDTGKIRGLLCLRCNTCIGIMDEKGFDWAEKAVEYLRNNNE